jgi:peptide-N4-(N-acetyl-beta-glucosaminyl)asparagine amidase
VQGRTSGDISWRIQRGETEAPPMSTEPVVISPTDAEIEAKSMIVEYDVVNNVYQRPNDGNSEAKGFASLMHHSNNIIRKVEHDWKMVYLCREKSEKSADLSWKFLFGNQKVKGVKISMGHFNTFHQSAQVMGTVCGGDVCTMLDGKSASHDPDANSGNNELELTDLTGAEYIELSINMRGGDGNNAWQQTQIFRTNLGDPRTNLKVIIEFE